MAKLKPMGLKNKLEEKNNVYEDIVLINFTDMDKDFKDREDIKLEGTAHQAYVAEALNITNIQLDHIYFKYDGNELITPKINLVQKAITECIKIFNEGVFEYVKETKEEIKRYKRISDDNDKKYVKPRKNFPNISLEIDPNTFKNNIEELKNILTNDVLEKSGAFPVYNSLVSLETLINLKSYLEFLSIQINKTKQRKENKKNNAGIKIR